MPNSPKLLIVWEESPNFPRCNFAIKHLKYNDSYFLGWIMFPQGHCFQKHNLRKTGSEKRCKAKNAALINNSKGSSSLLPVIFCSTRMRCACYALNVQPTSACYVYEQRLAVRQPLASLYESTMLLGLMHTSTLFLWGCVYQHVLHVHVFCFPWVSAPGTNGGKLHIDRHL